MIEYPVNIRNDYKKMNQIFLKVKKKIMNFSCNVVLLKKGMSDYQKCVRKCVIVAKVNLLYVIKNFDNLNKKSVKNK